MSRRAANKYHALALVPVNRSLFERRGSTPTDTELFSELPVGRSLLPIWMKSLCKSSLAVCCSSGATSSVRARMARGISSLVRCASQPSLIARASMSPCRPRQAFQVLARIVRQGGPPARRLPGHQVVFIPQMTRGADGLRGESVRRGAQFVPPFGREVPQQVLLAAGHPILGQAQVACVRPILPAGQKQILDCVRDAVSIPSKLFATNDLQHSCLGKLAQSLPYSVLLIHASTPRHRGSLFHESTRGRRNAQRNFAQWKCWRKAAAEKWTLPQATTLLAGVERRVETSARRTYWSTATTFTPCRNCWVTAM